MGGRFSQLSPFFFSMERDQATIPLMMQNAELQNVSGRRSVINNCNTEHHPFCIIPKGGTLRVYTNIVCWEPLIVRPPIFTAKWCGLPKIYKGSQHRYRQELGCNRNLVRIIKETINRFDAKSIIDVPYGNANWIFNSFGQCTLDLISPAWQSE